MVLLDSMEDARTCGFRVSDSFKGSYQGLGFRRFGVSGSIRVTRSVTLKVAVRVRCTVRLLLLWTFGLWMEDGRKV